MASSLTFINEWKYDVFLSFRGIDTRLGFTGSLHRALCGKEIKSFMDDKDLEKGAEINLALDEAIQNSRIALVILSKNYASSTFCLDELGKIMDCSKDKDMFVLPVFYEVEPSDVRYQKGKYADALNKHEARNIEKETIEKWRVALTKIANLSGWHFNHDRYEYELIDIIVQDIIKKIHSLRDDEKAKKIENTYSVAPEFLQQLRKTIHTIHEGERERREWVNRDLRAGLGSSNCWKGVAAEKDPNPKKSWMTIDKHVTQHNKAHVYEFESSPAQHLFSSAMPITYNPVLSKTHTIYKCALLKNIYCAKDDGKWEDQGPGHVSVNYLECSKELGLFVYGEEDNETILSHRIISDDIYRKEEDTIISWRDPEYATELALSFYEPSGCSYIWDNICSVQRNVQFNTSNRAKSVEINSKQQKVTGTGYVEPNKVLKKAKSTGKKAEICHYVPFNLVAGTMARSYENSFFDKFSDENPNACSIM